MSEMWRPVPGFEGLYEVSDHGRVRSLDREVVESGGRRRRHRGRVLAPGKRRDGRWKVELCQNRTQTSRLVAQLVLEAFVGPRPNGLEACHCDGDQGNDVVTNLRWDTHSENARDLVNHGRHNKGRRTHCPRGHDLVEPNIRAHDRRIGTRNCKACHRADSRVRWAAKKGMALDFQRTADAYYAEIMGQEVSAA